MEKTGCLRGGGFKPPCGYAPAINYLSKSLGKKKYSIYSSKSRVAIKGQDG
jgi:hypothetical protein